MSAFYRIVVDAALAVVTDAMENRGVPVVRRTRPAWVPLLDTANTVLIAPNERMQPVVVRLLFNNVVVLGYEVFVGSFVDDRQEDADQAWKVAENLEIARGALWEPEILGLRDLYGEFDVTFDPSGGAGQPPPTGVRGWWHCFRYDFKTQRFLG